MDKEQKRKLAEEVLTDEMSEYTMKHINDIRYLKDWIIDAMLEFSDKVNNGVLDDVSNRTWTVDEIKIELESIDEFKAAKYFFDEYGC